MSVFKKTKKQTEIMELLLKAADAGKMMGFEDIREGLSYGKTVVHQSIRISLNFLFKHDMISRNRVGRFTYYIPTAKAYTEFRSHFVL